MAVSTKIVHRRDTAANWTSTNPTLANGEIGFETDTLKFKVGNGSTAWTSLKYSQDASLLTGNASITTLTTTGDINTAGKLSVTASAGDEGGEIFLANAVTNTSINNGVTIDVYQNKLRFFEQGGDARGYYIDITAGGAGAATALTGGGGGTGTVTSITASSPLTGGTINTSGTIGINASSASTANYVVQRDANASFSVNALTATRVNYGTGTGAPTFTSYSAGVREVLYDNIDASQAGYAVGIDAGVLWHGLPGADAGQFFKWYGGVTEVAKLSGTGILTASSFVSNVASGTAPFAVTSNTLVTNLNADLLDGYNTDTASTANTVVVRDASQNFSANTITANLYGTANLATYIVGGATGSVPYQNAANTTTFLVAPATNNSILTYNTNTNAPEWDSPVLAMAVLMGYTSTVTAAGVTSLTNASTYYQQFTGTTTQTVILPNTATLITGWTFHIVNNSTGNVTANTFANAATLMVIPANTTAMVTCINTASNTATGWEIGLTDFGTYTGTGSVVMNTSPTLTTPNIGVATATSVNKVAITAPATSATLTIADSKTLTVNRSLILTGNTDGVTLTFPSTNATIARTDTSQTFTDTQTFSSSIRTPGITRAGAGETIILSTANVAGGSTGAISITSGNSTSTGSGGNITITAGNTAGTGAAGNIVLDAGSGGGGGGLINIGTAAGYTQPITLGTAGSVTTVPGDLVVGTATDNTTGLSVTSGSLFEFSGASTTNGDTTLSNLPTFTAFATSKPSMLISVTTANAATNTGRVGAEFRASATTLTHLITFSSGSNPGTARGSISVNSTTTTYSTSSDYRLKENIEPIAGATARLMLLKPSRFNFIEFPERVVDGFIAHEAQEVVPESVTGEKDELGEDGLPAYQGIDQSKMVPLLTAALQESVEEIQELKSTITDLLSRIEKLEN